MFIIQSRVYIGAKPCLVLKINRYYIQPYTVHKCICSQRHTHARTHTQYTRRPRRIAFVILQHESKSLGEEPLTVMCVREGCTVAPLLSLPVPITQTERSGGVESSLSLSLFFSQSDERSSVIASTTKSQATMFGGASPFFSPSSSSGSSSYPPLIYLPLSPSLLPPPPLPSLLRLYLSLPDATHWQRGSSHSS